VRKKCKIISMTGDMEIVDGYSSETLFSTDISAPNVKTQALTEATGYYATQQAARYYASAFVEMAFNNDYIENKNTNFSNTAAQLSFISSGVGAQDVSGMLIEGSFWYNEAKDYGSFEDYYAATKYEKTSRTLAWMPLPVQWEGSVTEGNGKAPTLLATDGYAFINGRFKNNEAVSSASKDFLKFLYTDEELSAFTATTGVAKCAIDYELLPADYEKLDDFQEGVWKMRSEGTVINQGGTAGTFLRNSKTLSIGTLAQIVRPKTNATYDSILSLLRTRNYGTKDYFDATCLDATEWSDYYQG